MGKLLTYSGIATKVRAMEGHLIRPEQYRELCFLETVQAAVDYLKALPAYADLFSAADESAWHRGMIEQQLRLSLYRDFSKLYRFSGMEQRNFLDLYFMHYEINIIKRCLRHILGHQAAKIDLSVFEEFFRKHSKLDLNKLCDAENLEEFIASLEGSYYYPMLERLERAENLTVFDYEMQLDRIFFQAIWHVKDKLLTKQESRLMAESFGTRLDLLTIQWIYRSKKYYHLADADIYALLLPFHYHLKTGQIRSMVEAGTMEDFYAALQHTRYGGLVDSDFSQPPNLEALYLEILDKLHTDAGRRNPYSIAVLNSYLYFKESEVRNIVTIIESIRYGEDGNEILAHINKQ